MAGGRVTQATTPDHIIPLATGGTDTDDNIQCLCFECHAIKTAGESNQWAASNHPTWLKPSAIPLTIVCGAPASGKTTYVQANAAPTDRVICFDSIITKIDPSYQHWVKDVNKARFNQAIRVRNALLGELSRANGGRAWFIIAAPTKAERDWWQSKLGGEMIVLDPGRQECERRADARGTPLAKQGIRRWYETKKWSPPGERVKAYGLDGWPIP